MMSVEKTNNDLLSKKMVSPIYHESGDVSVYAAELMTRFGHNVISLNSASYGSTSTCVVPSNDVLENVFLFLELPPIGLPGVGFVSLPYAWAFSAIERISCTVGTSNTTLTISGAQLLMLYQNEVEGQSKLDQILHGMGGDPKSTLGVNTTFEDWSNYPLQAMVPIGWLWSSLHTSQPMCNRGLSSDLLSASGVQFSITFKPLRKFVNVRDVNAGVLAPLGTSFSRCALYYRSNVFTDQSFSMKYELMKQGQKYVSPLKHLVDAGSQNIFATRTSANNLISNARISLSLSGGLNSDLHQLCFYVVPTLYIDGDDDVPIQPLNLTKLRNIQLNYLGNVIYNAPGYTDALISVLTSGKSGSTGFSHKGLSRVANLDVVDQVYEKKIVSTIDLSKTNFATCSQNVDNCVRYSANNALNLSFDIVCDQFNTADAVSYRVYASYVYMGTISIGQAVTKIEVM
jgi:hypothetical protein